MPARSRRTPGIAFNGRIQAICDVCGKVKRSNHNCKGAAENDRIARGRPKAVTVQAGGIDVTVAGQSFQVTKLTADGLKRIKQRKAPSKYQEILDLLMTLASVRPSSYLAARSQRMVYVLKPASCPDRALTSHLNDRYLTIIRSR
jgi:hypothetical protein